MRLTMSRSAVALASAGLLGIAAMGGAASGLTSGGIKGDPQPELKPFTIGASAGNAGSVAVESNGNLVVAYVNTRLGRQRRGVCDCPRRPLVHLQGQA